MLPARDARPHDRQFRHDLNTSLAIILGYAELLQGSLGHLDGLSGADHDQVRDDLAAILVAARRLSSLFNEAAHLSGEGGQP